MKNPLQTPLLAVLAAVTAASAAPATAQPKRDCGALPGTYVGVVYAGDGDTIYGPGLPPFRLWGVDTPELRDPGKAWTVPGMQARAFLGDLLHRAKNEAVCKPLEWDAYCRVVASCSAKDATTGEVFSLTFEILKAGYGISFYLARHPDHADEAAVYSRAEVEAREGRRGLWPVWLGEAKP